MDECFCFNAPSDELRKDIREVLKKHNVAIDSDMLNIRSALLIAYSLLDERKDNDK